MVSLRVLTRSSVPGPAFAMGPEHVQRCARLKHGRTGCKSQRTHATANRRSWVARPVRRLVSNTDPGGFDTLAACNATKPGPVGFGHRGTGHGEGPEMAGVHPATPPRYLLAG